MRVRQPGPIPLVTGVGGAAGISVVNALRTAGHRIVAADCDPRAAGLSLGDACGVLPAGDDPKFVDALCELAFLHGADSVVPTVAEEMAALNARSADLAAAGIACWVPSPDAVRLCLDKAAFARCLHGAGIATPVTAHPEAVGATRLTGTVGAFGRNGDTGAENVFGVPGPWIVKPRFGRGSRDVHTADEPEEVAWAVRRVTDPIVQTRISGREFTVDALVERDGRFAGGVPRWRDEVKAGISTKGETFADDRVLTGSALVLDAVGLQGVANVQGFVSESDGVVFTEVNPRFSGGLPLSLAAGAELVGEYLRAVFGLPIRAERLTYRTGVRMARFYSEVFVG